MNKIINLILKYAWENIKKTNTIVKDKKIKCMQDLE